MSIINKNIFIDGKPLEDLKVTELRSQLEIRNLSKSGVKKELYERLKNYIWSEHSEQNKQIEKNEVPLSQYTKSTEYRSLSDVQTIPMSLKSPKKSLNLLESQNTNIDQTFEEKIDQLQENDSFVSTAEETYNTANDETQIFDETEKKNELQCKLDYVEPEQLDDTMENQVIEIEESATPIKEDQKSFENTEQDIVGENKKEMNELYTEKDEKKLTDSKEEYRDAKSEMDFKHEQSNSLEKQKKTEEVELEEGGLEEENEEENKLDEELDYEENVHDEKLNKIDEPTLEIEEENVKSLENSDKVKTEEMLTPEGFVRRKEVSPARCKVSKLIHIHNLKRPFIVKSLKDLLSNFGNLIEDEFWIDGIKTNCIAKFETEEQAKLARERLHHVVWPSSSDTSLIVEYSTDEKLARRLGENMPTLTNAGKLGITVTVDNRDSNQRRENIDLNSSRKRTSGPDALPKKQLEDLFRKTNAKPHIYYLPLNDEEAEKRWVKKKEEEKKRLELTSNGYRNSIRQTLNGNSSYNNDRRYHYSSINSNRRNNYSPDRKRDRRFSRSRSRRR